MQTNEQITPVAEIKQIVDGFQSNIDLLTIALNVISGLRVKLMVDFSPDCTECGKYADFVKDFRDNLITKAQSSMAGFIAKLVQLQYVIDPDVNQTNADYLKQQKDFEAQTNEQQPNPYNQD